MPNDDDQLFEDMTNREILRVLLEEIALVRGELKGDIASIEERLSGRINGMEKGLNTKMDSLNRKIDNLNLKVDRNHLTFMHNFDEMDKRVLLLEKT